MPSRFRLAYDPHRNTVWVTNETGGSETIIDVITGILRGTVPLGSEAGNVAHDPGSGQILADVQSRNTLSVIDPATLTITRQVPLPGCDHGHGLTLDPPAGSRSSPATATPPCSHST
jgi:DNA-binding beta-propeller fold protein YncE